jgi:hypothetical protein
MLNELKTISTAIASARERTKAEIRDKKEGRQPGRRPRGAPKIQQGLLASGDPAE